MLRKHNPDLAGRVVGHGDGSISLVERGQGIEHVVMDDKDLKFGNSSVLDDEDDDFYVKPQGEESLVVVTKLNTPTRKNKTPNKENSCDDGNNNNDDVNNQSQNSTHESPEGKVSKPNGRE